MHSIPHLPTPFGSSFEENPWWQASLVRLRPFVFSGLVEDVPRRFAVSHYFRKLTGKYPIGFDFHRRGCEKRKPRRGVISLGFQRVGALMLSGYSIRCVREAFSPRLSLCATLLAALLAGSSVADAGVMFREDGGSAFLSESRDLTSVERSPTVVDLHGSRPVEDADQTPSEELDFSYCRGIHNSTGGAGSAPGSQVTSFFSAVAWAGVPGVFLAAPRVHRQWREGALCLPAPPILELLDPPKLHV